MYRSTSWQVLSHVFWLIWQKSCPALMPDWIEFVLPNDLLVHSTSSNSIERHTCLIMGIPAATSVASGSRALQRISATWESRDTWRYHNTLWSAAWKKGFTCRKGVSLVRKKLFRRLQEFKRIKKKYSWNFEVYFDWGERRWKKSKIRNWTRCVQGTER